VALAQLTTRLLRSLLLEIEAGDPITYAAAAAGMIIIALAASFFPARRAAMVDPLISIRAE
jgi:putative ABC transport system permease protein